MRLCSVLSARLFASSNLTILPNFNYPFNLGSSSCSRHSSDFTYHMAKSVTYRLHHYSSRGIKIMHVHKKNHYCNNVVPLSVNIMPRMLTKKRPPVQLPVNDGPDLIKLPMRRMCQLHHANHAISLPQCVWSVHSQICDQH